jgi:ferredoxin
MTKNYTVSKTTLVDLLSEWLTRYEVIAPVKHENFTRFSPLQSASEIVWGPPQSVLAPKKYFHPPREKLFSYELSNGEVKLRNEDEEKDKEKVLVGVHPCDLNAIYLMDQVFAEKNPDDYYLKKRQAAILVGVDCLARCSPEAICIRMEGLNPRDRFDLFLTDLGQSFFVEAATQRGEGLISAAARPVKTADRQKLKNLRQKRDRLFDRETPKLLPRYHDLPKLMKDNYNSPEWQERGEKDYACGSCNLVCPTCYCFDVQEEVKIDGKSGFRKRVWDGCMLADFAKVSSGENFREERGERLRHRTYRKLYYLFEKWEQSFCTGCGRCIKACLTKIVNPLEIANAIYTRAGKTKQS